MPDDTPSCHIAPRDLLTWWFEEIGPKGWYSGEAWIDEAAREKYLACHREAMAGGLGLWLVDRAGCLGYIVLLDQLSRNMFRDTAEAFASDPMARAAAKAAIDKGWDLLWTGTTRQFFYLPLMHSESLVDQDRAVRLFQTRMPQDDGSSLLHARAHRAVIRKFGRFPTRNAALGRRTTAAEQAWLEQGGYGAELRLLKATAS